MHHPPPSAPWLTACEQQLALLRQKTGQSRQSNASAATTPPAPQLTRAPLIPTATPASSALPLPILQQWISALHERVAAVCIGIRLPSDITSPLQPDEHAALADHLNVDTQCLTPLWQVAHGHAFYDLADALENHLLEQYWEADTTLDAARQAYHLALAKKHQATQLIQQLQPIKAQCWEATRIL